MNNGFMRLIVFFDLPVVRREDRKSYQRFRNFLLNDGYYMVQFSVYSRICNGSEGVEKHISRLNKNLPSRGSVRYIQITEKQFSNMKIVVGKPKAQEKLVSSHQLSLF